MSGYLRTVHFQDTDSAGVVFFAQILAFCHEAYEAALATAGFNLPEFFSDRGAVIMPITATQAQFYRPILCGDRLLIKFRVEQPSSTGFVLHYQICQHSDPSRPIAQASTTHICLDTQTRSPLPLPYSLQTWVDQGVMGLLPCAPNLCYPDPR
ncbi:MAG: thioesterase family protein [Pseudanabaenaceae cyanobacterium bins.68]|nr:thioesterase family protein [Pseudanabaenaceae cyanobacterium bins.68]